MAQSQQSKNKQHELGGSLQKLYAGLNGTSATDLHVDKNAASRNLMDPYMDRKCCLENPAIAKGCVINNPEDCFEANRCEQCPDNKNHG